MKRLLVILLISASLFATQSKHAATLAWTVSPTAVSYNVYRSQTSGSGYVMICSSTGTTYRDAMVSAGQTYFYVITAVDVNGNESAYSNEMKAVIPADPQPVQNVTATVE